MYFKILVPLDGSPLAEMALPVARAVAWRCNAELEILMVVPNGDPAAAGEAQNGLEPYLSAAAEQAEIGEGVIRWHVLNGDAPGEIVNFARSQGFSLIIMATHGRTGFVRGLLGSVTDRVILTSPVPVLVVNGGAAPDADFDDAEFDNIVVPLDGSELAESSLEHGAVLAKAFGANLVLLRVANPASNRIERSLAENYLIGIMSWLKVERITVTIALRTAIRANW
ncbi:MAG: universal stress protein [Chloroflexi bacterium]|nr:universal stress protein [Chloroflexota bacterium]